MRDNVKLKMQYKRFVSILNKIISKTKWIMYSITIVVDDIETKLIGK